MATDLASTMPAPLSTVMLDEEEPGRRSTKMGGKKKGGKKRADAKMGQSLDATMGVEYLARTQGAPIAAQAAWATPNAVPDKLDRGRSGRLYL